jgi:Transposase DDE domain group 1
MTDNTPLPFDLPSVRRKKLTVDFDGGNQSSDGGLLLLRQAERKLGVCRRLADAMPDRRDPDRIRHAMFEMVMARVAAIACGHKDAIDLDRLRHDPLLSGDRGAVGLASDRAIRDRRGDCSSISRPAPAGD